MFQLRVPFYSIFYPVFGLRSIFLTFSFFAQHLITSGVHDMPSFLFEYFFLRSSLPWRNRVSRSAELTSKFFLSVVFSKYFGFSFPKVKPLHVICTVNFFSFSFVSLVRPFSKRQNYLPSSAWIRPRNPHTNRETQPKVQVLYFMFWVPRVPRFRKEKHAKRKAFDRNWRNAI